MYSPGTIASKPQVATVTQVATSLLYPRIIYETVESSQRSDLQTATIYLYPEDESTFSTSVGSVVVIDDVVLVHDVDPDEVSYDAVSVGTVVEIDDVVLVHDTDPDEVSYDAITVGSVVTIDDVVQVHDVDADEVSFDAIVVGTVVTIE